MTDTIDPTAPNYTAKCVAQHRYQLLAGALARFLDESELPGFIDNIEWRVDAEIRAEQKHLRDHCDLKARLNSLTADYQLMRMQRINHELQTILERIPSIENEFRDEPGRSMLKFRRWFIRHALGLDCEEAALDAMVSFMIEVGAQTLPAFTMAELKLIPELVLSLREALMDYLTFPGLSRYELANIARAQLGLQTINGSVPLAWHGLCFRDMVRAHLGLITVPAHQPAFAKAVAMPKSLVGATPN